MKNKRTKARKSVFEPRPIEGVGWGNGLKIRHSSNTRGTVKFQPVNRTRIDRGYVAPRKSKLDTPRTPNSAGEAALGKNKSLKDRLSNGGFHLKPPGF